MANGGADGKVRQRRTTQDRQSRRESAPSDTWRCMPIFLVSLAAFALGGCGSPCGAVAIDPAADGVGARR